MGASWWIGYWLIIVLLHVKHIYNVSETYLVLSGLYYNLCFKYYNALATEILKKKKKLMGKDMVKEHG